MTIEFQPYGKTPRLFRDMVVTEKIDGTNAGVQILRAPTCNTPTDLENVKDNVTAWVGIDGAFYAVVAQSRNRIITPGNDNAGFAAWVYSVAANLVATLGEGTHFGEWYGPGIQGNPLGVDRKRFALFNVHRWGGFDFEAHGLPEVETVPVLYTGPFSSDVVARRVDDLIRTGSFVAGANIFAKPEGVVVYHSAARQVFKVLCDSDDLPKTLRDAA